MTVFLFFCSTGSAFINPPQQYTPQGPPKQGPPPGGIPPPRPPGRSNWDHRDEQRFDPRRGPPGPPQGPPRGDDRNASPGGPQGRFGPSDPRNTPGGPKGHERGFGGPMHEDRFRGGSNFGNRDEFGRDIRKDDSRFSHDKDSRDSFRERDRDSKPDREKERSRDRDYKKRSTKRSLSPVNSVSSSTSSRPIPAANVFNKRRFEPCNIPKNSLIRNSLNSSELKSRMSSTVHIPSDLKEVIYSEDLEFDLLDIPKPIVYKVVEHKRESDKESKSSAQTESKSQEEKAESAEKPAEPEKTEKTEEKEPKEEKTESKEAAPEGNGSEIEVEKDEPKKEKEPEEKPEEKKEETEEKQPENVESEAQAEKESPAAGEEMKPTEKASDNVSAKSTEHTPQKNHKFNVKVLLVSLPEMTEIYERIFGPDFDGGSNR